MTSYQPPSTFSTSSNTIPNAPIQYGQDKKVDHEITTQKLELKRELQTQEALLKGKIGWAFMIWFIIMILCSLKFAMSSYNTFIEDYTFYKRLMGVEAYNRLMICFMILGAWMIIQSLLTIYAVRKLSVLGAKLLRGAMVVYIAVSSFFAWGYISHDSKFTESERNSLWISWAIPVVGSLVVTWVLKIQLQKRERLIKRLDAIEASNV